MVELLISRLINIADSRLWHTSASFFLLFSLLTKPKPQTLRWEREVETTQPTHVDTLFVYGQKETERGTFQREQEILPSSISATAAGAEPNYGLSNVKLVSRAQPEMK